jgi:hypothetical protein
MQCDFDRYKSDFKSLISTQEWFLHAECDFDTYECDYNNHEHDYETHDYDLYKHELNFNTMRVILTRTNKHYSKIIKKIQIWF